MPKIETIIFDFDGTIADTMHELLDIYNKLAPSYNCQIIHEDEIEKLQKQRPQDFFHHYGVTPFKLLRLVLKGRKMLNKNITHMQPFKGVPEVLIALKELGIQLGVLTSNSKKNIQTFLTHYNLYELFNFVYSGKNIFGKAHKIDKIIKKHKLNRKRILFIGDETRDVEAAKKASILCLAVTWGFNHQEVLEALKPDFIATKSEEILQTIHEISVK